MSQQAYFTQYAGTTADGSVFTWGRGYGGRLGLGADWSDKLVPTLVGGELQAKAVVQVAVGGGHPACVSYDGSV